MNDTATLKSGSTFGRYVIRRALGSGGFGAVYEAVQQPLGKVVALKILHAAQLGNLEALRRFTSEAEATAKLRHPHIVDVIDLGAHEGVPFIAMEFLEGESLAQRIDRAGRLSVRAAVDLLIPVFSAVATVHDAGIVHRDLKPDNIFLAVVRPGKVRGKLLDFGIAKVKEAQHALTRTGSMMGTVYYMSPEQAREAKDVDGRSDQWALGVILFECVTGRWPFPGEAMIDVLTGIISAPLPPLSDVVDLPVGFEAVLQRAMSKNREERFRSTYAMGAALLPFASPSVREEWAAEFEGNAHETEDVLASAVTLDARPSAAPDTLVTSPPPALLAQSLALTGREIPAPTRVVSQPENGTRSAKRRTLIMTACTVGAMVMVGAVGFTIRTSGARHEGTVQVTQFPTPYIVAIETSPLIARVEMDGEFVGVGRVTRSVPRDGRVHRLRVTAEGHVSREVDFDAERRPPQRLSLDPVRVQPALPLVEVPSVPPQPARVPRRVGVTRPAAPVQQPPVETPVPAGRAPNENALTGTGIEIH